MFLLILIFVLGFARKFYSERKMGSLLTMVQMMYRWWSNLVFKKTQIIILEDVTMYTAKVDAKIV